MPHVHELGAAVIKRRFGWFMILGCIPLWLKELQFNLHSNVGMGDRNSLICLSMILDLWSVHE
jgi:hypothetical protein